jgi:hypothetical protein
MPSAATPPDRAPGPPDRPGRPGRAAPWIGLAAGAAYVAARAWQWRGWFMDDAFIGFRYAAHLAAGEGVVFNPGERVEGITNLGWTLLLALAGGREAIPGLAKLLGLVALLAALALLTAAGRRLLAPDEPGAAAAALQLPLTLLVAATPELAYYSHTGIESGQAAALVAALGFLAAGGGRGWGLGLVAAALVTVRPESVLVLPVAWVALALDRGAPAALRRRLGRATAVLAAGAVAVTLFRLAVFGDALPNTFRAKQAALADLPLHALASLGGAHSNLPPPFAGLFFPLLGLVGLAALRRRSPAAAVLFIALGLDRTQRLFGWEAAHAKPGYIATGATLVAPARWMAGHLPAGATLATRRLGVVGFVTDLPVFDYAFGLTDREVAHRVAARRAMFTDPRDPGLADLWQRADPDYLLEDESTVRAWLGEGTTASRPGAPPIELATLDIHGRRYRLARRFPIGDGTAFWLLYERTGGRPGE